MKKNLTRGCFVKNSLFDSLFSSESCVFCHRLLSSFENVPFMTVYVFGSGWTCVWCFAFSCFSFFFTRFSFKGQSALFTHYSSIVHALFMGPITTLLKKKKKGSHDTIHTFKNYFATVFSVKLELTKQSFPYIFSGTLAVYTCPCMRAHTISMYMHGLSYVCVHTLLQPFFSKNNFILPK